MKWFQSKSLRQQVLIIKYFSHTVLVFIVDFEYVFTKLDLIAVGNQQTFTRSKSTIETLAQGIFKVNNKDTRTSPKMKRLAKIVNGKPLAILAKRFRWRRSGILIDNFENILQFFYCFNCWLWTSKILLERPCLNSIIGNQYIQALF